MKDNRRNEFARYCFNINDACRRSQKFDKELVSARDAFIATTIVRSIDVRDTGDLLLFGASMNLLNTYVKQPGNKKTFGYGFKKNANIITKFLAEKHEGVEAVLMKDHGMPYLLVSVNDVQFSFHRIAVTEEMKKLRGNKNIEWDGIRKQMCANTFFKLARKNEAFFTDRTFQGTCLSDEIRRLEALYDEGKVSLYDIRSLHLGGTETTDEFLKRVMP